MHDYEDVLCVFDKGDNMELPNRKSIRLKGYDYSSNGAYFVTICTQNRLNLFGEIIVGADSISARMNLNNPGRMIDEILNETLNEFADVILDKYIIMPNHVHMIIIISRADMESAPTIPTIMQSFKRNTTIKYINGVNDGNFQPFYKKMWQRSYHDHIIRNEVEYQKIWQYIDENSMKWAEDKYYI